MNDTLKQLQDALAVMVLTPEIRAHLSANDPQALKQAEKALRASGLDVSRSLQAIAALKKGAAYEVQQATR